MAPGIEDLFDTKRVPGGLSFLLFLLYCPFGAFLCLLRLLFCIQLAIVLVILPKDFIIRKIVLRICGAILGIFTFVKDSEKSFGFKILICNNVSALDSLVLESVETHVLVSRSFKFPTFIQWMMGYENFGASSSSLSKRLTEISASNSGPNFSALVFPEESPTNGKVSLLKFSPWPFQCGSIYQPLLLTARRPSVLPIKLTVIDGGFWSDFLWTLFMPYTVYRVRYLSKMEKPASVSAELFAKSMYKEMSEVLCLQPSQFDINDKKEYVKRMQRAQQEVLDRRNQQTFPRMELPLQRQPPTQRPSSAAKIDKMIQQVKDVFPQVPIHVIRQDILKSKSVDGTLANILEARLSYTPLTAEESEAEKRLQLEKKGKHSKNKADEAKTLRRALSYEEQKKIMIEDAKRLYLEKHPEYRA